MKQYSIGFAVFVLGIGTIWYTYTKESFSANTAVRDVRVVHDFNRVELRGGGILIVTQSDKESLVIETKDNVLKKIKTFVNDGTLEIDVQKNWVETILQKTPSIEYHLFVKDISYIGFSGVGELRSEGLSTEKLIVEFGGTGSGALSVEVQNLETYFSGSTTFMLTGIADSHHLSLNGTHELDAAKLISNDTKVSINGYGQGILTAFKSLDVSINGNGTVRYIGSPVIAQQIEISGSGSVSKYIP